MMFATSNQREEMLFNMVQTMLNKSPEDLKLLSVEPVSEGFKIFYSIYQYDMWERSDMILYNSQMILMLGISLLNKEIISTCLLTNSIE